MILDELDGLLAHGIEYVYFIDEIFLPNRELLQALVERPIRFGVQTRVDLWTPAMLELLGQPCECHLATEVRADPGRIDYVIAMWASGRRLQDG